MHFSKVAAILLALALPLGATMIQNDLPVPLFDGRAHVSSFTDTGSQAATCTPTNVTFVEDPVTSGFYVAEFNGTTSVINCGTGLDGLHSSGTRFVRVKVNGNGEGGAGMIFEKETDASNRSWRVIIDTGANCSSPLCANFTNFNTSNVGRPRTTPGDSFDVTGNYIDFAVVVVCTSTTIESCAGTRLYINGLPVTPTIAATTGTTRTADSGDTFWIGNNSAGSATFDGRIGRTVVYSQALTQWQVQAVHVKTLALETAIITPTISAVTETDCAALAPTVWNPAGYNEPFEKTAAQTQLGDACRVWAPGPKERQ